MQSIHRKNPHGLTGAVDIRQQIGQLKIFAFPLVFMAEGGCDILHRRLLHLRSGSISGVEMRSLCPGWTAQRPCRKAPDMALAVSHPLNLGHVSGHPKALPSLLSCKTAISSSAQRQRGS